MASIDLKLLTTEVLDAPVPVMRAAGELDIDTAAQLCGAIHEAATTARPPRVVIDLTGVSFCDSTGLRALIGAVREVEVLGGRAVVAVEPEGALDRVLMLSGLGEFLRVCDSAEAAAARLAGQPARAAYCPGDAQRHRRAGQRPRRDRLGQPVARARRRGRA